MWKVLIVLCKGLQTHSFFHAISVSLSKHKNFRFTNITFHQTNIVFVYMVEKMYVIIFLNDLCYKNKEKRNKIEKKNNNLLKYVSRLLHNIMYVFQLKSVLWHICDY